MSNILVFPLHDTNGDMLLHLDKITPTLKKEFDKVVLSVSALTTQLFRSKVEKIKKNKLFAVDYNTKGGGFGSDHFTAFQFAVKQSKKDDILHLATLDKLANILETDYKKQFLKDIKNKENKYPLIFTRSKKAWESYPKNYKAIEAMLTTLGKELFDQELDFAWCHMVLKQQTLKKVLPRFQKKDNSIYGETVIVLLNEKIKIKPVDWLSWEDPHILDRKLKDLKAEREIDPNENAKRLSYTIPTIHLMLERFTNVESTPVTSKTGRKT